MKSYDQQWAEVEAFISNPARTTEAPSALAASWQEQVRWLRNTKSKIEHRAEKAFHFRAVNVNNDAINRKVAPEARNVPDEGVRRAYRELWKEDLVHRAWVQQ